MPDDDHSAKNGCQKRLKPKEMGVPLAAGRKIRRFLFRIKLVYIVPMKIFASRNKEKILADKSLSAGEKAHRLYDLGENCAQAVLQATCVGVNSEIIEMASVFGGGIDDSKCLCGAVTGGAMSLSLQGKAHKASRLVEEFKNKYRTTCCKGLTLPYQWMSREHLENCRAMTAGTADMVARLLEKKA